MKQINKWITRLFWGGFDLRIGLQKFIPIPKTYLYTTPLLAIFFYQLVIMNSYPIFLGLKGIIPLALFLFVMYVIFIHWKIWPVKWNDLTNYQKWLFGKGIKYNNSGLKDKLTPEQETEWEELDKQSKET